MIINAACLDHLPSVADQSIDLLLTDPPYPEIKRDYGTLTEPQWHELMDAVVKQAKRVLKPQGSAVFILQPNYKHVGQMRLWLWEFLVRTARDWNLVQNIYYHKPDALPLAGCSRKQGLTRSCVKYCLWFGSPNCYRNQDEVLVTPCNPDSKRLTNDSLDYQPSGRSMRDGRCYGASIERGGATPFNLLTMTNQPGKESGSYGHGAGTPYKLCDWWIRYASPPQGTVLDPFCGAGTIPLAAQNNERNFIGIEKEARYCDISNARLANKKAPVG